MSNVPEGLKYSREHEWVKMEGNLAVIGITDHAQHQLGDIVFIELPKVGAALQLMKPLGVVESVKAASDIFSPITGKVVAINEALVKAPETVNSDCYEKGWMVKIEPGKPDELNNLLDPKAYAALIEGL